jgi:c-di-GMP-binding flagellar brake protein YcgR
MALEMGGVIAALTREVRVRLLNISASGCLVEGDRQMSVGTVGSLQLRIGEEEYADDIEVVRCDLVERAHAAYLMGMRFLGTSPSDARSIRRAVVREVAELTATAKQPWVM